MQWMQQVSSRCQSGPLQNVFSATLNKTHSFQILNICLIKISLNSSSLLGVDKLVEMKNH